jgi:hypothetical protein
MKNLNSYQILYNMKAKLLFGVAFILMLGTLQSCKKDKYVPNKVPSVNAGADKTITLPVNSSTLSGSAIDEDGKVVSYLWSQVSGPSSSTLVNPGSASTAVQGLSEGRYVFQLTATDNEGTTGFDTTSIVVNPNPIKTVTLSPVNNPTEVRVTVLGTQNISGTSTEMSIATWTSGGILWKLREYLKFDLSSIPQNASIISANLFLYSNPEPLTGNLVDANFGSNNSLLIQQVNSNWSPSTISWENQPSVSSTNQISINSTSQSFLDLNVDVKNNIASMVNTNSNYGFLLRLTNEEIYNSRIFVSSYNTKYPDKRPKLVVVYQ